jgi:hypothetical protein
MIPEDNAGAAKRREQSDDATEVCDREISEASADSTLQEAQRLVLPDVVDLETEGATQAFAIPETPPFMQDDAADGESDDPSPDDRK